MYIFIHKKTPSGVIRPNGVPHPAEDFAEVLVCLGEVLV